MEDNKQLAKDMAKAEREIDKYHKQNSTMYKLFFGFKKLGEFGTISEAKKHANNSGLSGVFTLIGDKYRDSWYMSTSEAKNKENFGIQLE